MFQLEKSGHLWGFVVLPDQTTHTPTATMAKNSLVPSLCYFVLFVFVVLHFGASSEGHECIHDEIMAKYPVVRLDPSLDPSIRSGEQEQQFQNETIHCFTLPPHLNKNTKIQLLLSTSSLLQKELQRGTGVPFVLNFSMTLPWLQRRPHSCRTSSCPKPLGGSSLPSLWCHSTNPLSFQWVAAPLHSILPQAPINTLTPAD